MARLAGRLLMRQGGYPCDNLWGRSRDARQGACRAAGLPPFLHQPLLPPPHACLRRARPAHDLAGAAHVSAQKHDLGAPDVLLRGVEILPDPLETLSVRRTEVDDYTATHPADSHGRRPMGILNRTQG